MHLVPDMLALWSLNYRHAPQFQTGHIIHDDDVRGSNLHVLQSYYDRLVSLASATSPSEEASSSSSSQGVAALSSSQSAPSALESSATSVAPAKPCAPPAEPAASDPLPLPTNPFGPSTDSNPLVNKPEPDGRDVSPGKRASVTKPSAVNPSAGLSEAASGTTQGVGARVEEVGADSATGKGTKSTPAQKAGAPGAKVVRFASNPVYSPGTSADSGPHGSHVGGAGPGSVDPKRVTTPHMRGAHRPPTPAKLKLHKHNKENAAPDVELAIHCPGPFPNKGSEVGFRSSNNSFLHMFL
jgi:hypothetical protein